MPNRENDPPQLLLAVATEVVKPWMVGLVERITGSLPDPDDDLGRIIDEQTTWAIDNLRELLGRDVEEQRDTPLGILRRATAPLGAALLAAGFPAPARDEFEKERFPDDIYQMAPANWDDVHPDMTAAGLNWGAWKAATIMARHRRTGDG